MNPLISIIIVGYNAKKWLKECLDSVYAQTYQNFEIIFVDDASTDGSSAFLRDNYPRVKVIVNKENSGFAKNNNIALKETRGEYILLLNTDTRIEQNFLEKLIKAFQEIPNLGVVQPRLILMYQPDKLDVCGTFWTSFGLLYHYGSYKDRNREKYNKNMPIFSGKGACLLIKREVIDRVGLFDDDFWGYYEETDFCHRVWLAGYECWYYPHADCYHANGGTNTVLFKNSYIQFHSAKNKTLSFLKNFEIGTLIKIFPPYLAFNFVVSMAWLLQGKVKNSLSLYRALLWNIGQLPNTLNKRRKIQKDRVKKDRDIFRIIKKNPRLSFYYYAFIGSDKYEDQEI